MTSYERLLKSATEWAEKNPEMSKEEARATAVWGHISDADDPWQFKEHFMDLLTTGWLRFDGER